MEVLFWQSNHLENFSFFYFITFISHIRTPFVILFSSQLSLEIPEWLCYHVNGYSHINNLNYEWLNKAEGKIGEAELIKVGILEEKISYLCYNREEKTVLANT